MCKKNRKSRILYPNLIVCEGVDAYYFLLSYLAFHINKVSSFDTIQVWNFGGIDELTTELSILQRTPGIEALRSVIILRDAEGNAAAAVDSIRNSLGSVGWPAPATVNTFAVADDGLKVAFSLFPNFDSATSGTLEDLCIDIVKEPGAEALRRDVEGFIESVEDKYQRGFRRHKAVLHCYFSVTKDFEGLKVGELTAANAFKLDCSPLDKLESLLSEATKV